MSIAVLLCLWLCLVVMNNRFGMLAVCCHGFGDKHVCSDGESDLQICFHGRELVVCFGSCAGDDDSGVNMVIYGLFWW